MAGAGPSCFVFVSTLALFCSDTVRRTRAENLKSLVLLDTTITLAEALPAGANPARTSSTAALRSDLPGCCAHSSVSRFRHRNGTVAPGDWLEWQISGHGNREDSWPDSVRPTDVWHRARLRHSVQRYGSQERHGRCELGVGSSGKVTDFMYRAVHEMTVKGKAITQAFYGPAPQRSYWRGCSTAGNQGIKEAQLYPQDYDGITVAAPVNNWSHQEAAHLYNALSTSKTELAAPEYIPPEKWPIMSNAALAVCDARDGLADGLITDPSNCDFDPATLLCPFGGISPARSLTPAQVQTRRKIYEGAKFSNGEVFPRTAAIQRVRSGAYRRRSRPYAVATNHFKYLVLPTPGWDWRTFNPDTGVPLADSAQSAGLNSPGPNLAPFKARGGKLIVSHGWLDPSVFAKNSVNYYQSVVNAMGGVAQTDDFFRLFMAPGVNHCGGGHRSRRY